MKIFKLFIVCIVFFSSFSSLACISFSENSTTNSESSTSFSGDFSTSEEGNLSSTLSYPIVGTGVSTFYNNNSVISQPQEGEAFFGQDATYSYNNPTYTDNQDGTITDNITGLVWQKTLDDKMTYEQSFEYASESTLASFTDWRVPTIKELYSLILFTGCCDGESAGEKQFINTDFFDQPIGNTMIGEREIDAQTWSCTQYTSTTMNGDETIFGVNFVDGRIKGYPLFNLEEKDFQTNYVRLVRGNENYGKNNFVDNGNGTITDFSTGLMWQTQDSEVGLDWQNALSYCENLQTASFDDWRLPNAKELQSIVDYDCLGVSSGILALDEMFSATPILDGDSNKQYAYYWTSTTHLDGLLPNKAVYIAFGQAQGEMNGALLDVHGAGSQRSDPKSGSLLDYPTAFGPQGDIQRVYNLVRAVRSIF